MHVFSINMNRVKMSLGFFTFYMLFDQQNKGFYICIDACFMGYINIEEVDFLTVFFKL